MLSTIPILSVLLGFLIQSSDARISGDLSCAVFNGTDYAYTPNAVACSNSISDMSCSILYPAAVTDEGYPRAGSDVERPLACYTTETATPAATVNDMKTAAIRNCPRTCGLCCLTTAYNCKNVQYPRINCNTVTAAMCQSPTWRSIVSVDCPATCGTCNSNGCLDLVTGCGNDPAICTLPTMADFVRQYCKRTCNFC